MEGYTGKNVNWGQKGSIQKITNEELQYCSESIPNEKQAIVASVQIILFFCVVSVLVWLWFRTLIKQNRLKHPSDLVGMILVLSCAPLVLSFLGTFVLVFQAVAWLIYPSSYDPNLLKLTSLFRTATG